MTSSGSSPGMLWPTAVAMVSVAFFTPAIICLSHWIRQRTRTSSQCFGAQGLPFQDAMPPAIQAVVDGSMYATVRNSSCRIHGGAIVAGVEAALAGKKTLATPPKQIIVDGPIVTQANAPGLLWMEDHFLI